MFLHFANRSSTAGAAAAMLLPLLLLLGDHGSIDNNGGFPTVAAAVAVPAADKILGKDTEQRELYLKHYPEPALKWETRLDNTGTIDR